MPATQETRPLAVTTPLGDDVLLLRSMSATEQLGRPFEFHLDLLSLDDSINMEDLLGQPVTVRLQMTADKERFFHGNVSHFSQGGLKENYILYQATLRPWLWFLTRTADCRIFQKMSVPDIIKQIFRDQGFSDFDDSLSGSYRTWEYCVQYRETDFNFVSRLMEQEGIYYYFKHEENKHKLVLADSYSSHEPISGYESVPYFPPTDQAIREEDHFFEWSISKEAQPGACSLNEFDFERPKASLEVKSSIAPGHASDDLEIYDYPGEYVESGDGETYAKVRLEEYHAQYEHVVGTGNARGLAAGALFELSDYPRGDQNREYLVVAATHEMRSDEYGPTSAGAGAVYSGSITAIESQRPFRSARTTPKPMVQGPQTAIVVGKAGEEIWTDKYGRVKVQFHWDREGQSDENSSCWVRVAQLWAGKTWGGIQIPRMGQEVIIEFLEGDPDRPIITGRVYNADCMPPYELPENQTQSGTKSRSTKEGTGENFNEFRFEDKKGEEQVYIHAEKNQDSVVENNETHWVGNDRKKDVGNNENTNIGCDRTERVEKNESISVGGTRTEDVEKDEIIFIGENRTEEVKKDETITIGANRTETVGKDETITVRQNRTEEVGKNENVTVGEDRVHDIGKIDTLKIGKKLLINVGDEILLQTGSSSVSMKKDGTIIIKGKDISIDGSGKIDVTASGNITMKGSQIKQN